MRRLFLVLTLFALLFYSIHVKFNLVEVKASNDYPVHNLNTGLNYTTIQEAINANETLNGNTVFVESGMYQEYVVVNKSLSILGENREETIVDGNGTGTAICIESQNTSLRGFTVKNASYGIIVLSTVYQTVRKVVIDDNIISDNSNCGVEIVGHSHPPLFDDNVVKNNIVKNNKIGIFLSGSQNNTIYQNEVKNNSDYGIQLIGSPYQPPEWRGSHMNQVICNDLIDNGVGLDLLGMDNKFYHNNFVDNMNQAHVHYHLSYNNSWCCDYPAEGNYWSNYSGTDSNHDGIGDTPHNIDENNEDNYPLMGMFYDFTVEIEWGQIYHVTAISNSTVSDLHVLWWLSSPNEYVQPSQKFIDFYVTGEEGTVGFCRTMIPRAVLNDSYTVLVDWQEVPVKELPISNSTHAYLYFTYNHSTQEVIIIPEFPSFLILPLFLIATLLAVIVYKRKHTMQQRSVFPNHLL